MFSGNTNDLEVQPYTDITTQIDLFSVTGLMTTGVETAGLLAVGE